MAPMSGPQTADRFAELRERMVREQLEARGIRDRRVLDAMRRIPRERFVPEHLRERAYDDAALPVECGQTISQPYMVAKMTELLELTGRERVLEIGTGTGYQTAILALLAAHVYTIERHLPLLTAASRRLDGLGLTNVTYRCADGSRGWPEEAPFEAILVAAGAPDVPASLEAQLAVGGRLVIPVGPPTGQVLVRVIRREDGLQRQTLFPCRFVKLLGAEGWTD